MPKRYRDQVISLRVSPEEYRQLNALTGPLRRSAFIRGAVHSALRRVQDGKSTLDQVFEASPGRGAK